MHNSPMALELQSPSTLPRQTLVGAVHVIRGVGSRTGVIYWAPQSPSKSETDEFPALKMDPLTAVGLAGNIVQFVDFACNLFSTSSQIRTSSKGLTDYLDSVECVTADLKQICTTLTASLSEDSFATEDRQIASLGTQCLRIAEKLLATVVKLKPREGSSRRGSFQAALKTIWQQDEIDRMTLQLNGLRMELMLRMQFARQPETLVAASMKRVSDETKETRIRLTQSLDLLRSDVSQLSQQLQRHTTATSPTYTVDGEDYDLLTQELPEYAAQLMVASTRQNYLLDLISLFKSLHFEGIDFRYSKITRAHPDTYVWAYEHKFADFLQSGEPLFWVSGKPGSGKSTFMKFLVNNPRTTEYLTSWAGQRTMMASNYFFWINGSAVQRSQEGLLRSIVLDILLQCPKLRSIALKFAKELDHSGWPISGASMLGSWNLSRLFNLLMLITAKSQSTYCLCLFIDGLDEYDGDSQGLIELLTSLQEFPNVKLCVASRPLNEFESAFGFNQGHKIYMQHLTSADISIFVKDKLEQSPDFERLTEKGTGVNHLILDITEAAQGVFLWVRLVVQSLLRGLQNADRILDLRRRLADYPRDLDDFFRYILDSLDPIYRVQVAQGFAAAQAAPRALSILQFWYLDHEDEDPDYAMKTRLSSTYVPDAIQHLRRRDGLRALHMTKRIVGRFKGLLEVTHETCGRTYLSEGGDHIYEMKVDFLHRTVKDFLATTTCRNIISLWTPVSFNVYESLCKAYLTDLKEACARPECLINSGYVRELVEDFFRARAGHETHTGDDLEYLSQELLTISKSPTPSYYGTSLEKLLGKSFFSESNIRRYSHLFPPKEDDNLGSILRSSGNLASKPDDCGIYEDLSFTGSRHLRTTDRHAWATKGFKWMDTAVDHMNYTSNPIPPYLRQLVDEKSLFTHLRQRRDVTLDQLRYALNSGQMSPTFVRGLLDCLTESSEGQPSVTTDGQAGNCRLDLEASPLSSSAQPSDEVPGETSACAISEIGG
ncbi:hypothetical protein LTS15_010990 [Exophiala xenobiotica]|nr:hypothetical protein LTS15_010990 [Exophiala xenobiotica]